MKFMKVSLMAFIDERGDVLLNKRRNSKNQEMWDLVGGGIEEGETPREAIVREMREELSYILDPSLITELGTREIKTEKYEAEVTFFTAKSPRIDEFKSSDEVFVEDLFFLSKSEALKKKLLPMTQLLFDEEILER